MGAPLTVLVTGAGGPLGANLCRSLRAAPTPPRLVGTDANRWHLPLSLGYLSAWSQPIKDAHGRVLGTFGTYFRRRREPTEQEREVVGLLARIAAAALTRRQAA